MERSSEDSPQSNGNRLVSVTAGGLLVLLVLAFAVTWSSTPLWHTVTEVVAVCLALFAGMIAWLRHRESDDVVFLLIAIGFVATAVLDGVHAFVTADGVTGQLPAWLSSLVPWSWLASRCLLSVCLYLSWVAWKHTEFKRRLSRRNVYWLVGGLSAGLLAAAILSPFSQSAYPNLWVYRPAELIPGAFFVLALVGFVNKQGWRNDGFELWLVCSLLVASVSQILVMPFSLNLFDGRFDLGHGLKLTSYAMIVIGLLKSVSVAGEQFRQLGQLHEAKVAELARANEGLRVFLRSASHDLKAPIRHIAGFSGFLLEDAKDRLTEEEADDLRRIGQAADHMSKLLESLLKFAKFDAASVKPTQFSVNQAVDAAVVQLPMQDQMRVTYEDLGELVGDQSLMTVVFQNLIENGLKYTRQGDSQVVVRAEPVESGVMVSVQDDGIGVAPEQSQRIFEPGVRAVAESEFEGTGFGLATCARIIEAHEGRIGVEPNPNQGSVFKFVLPTVSET